ncbi:hypothetical protein PGT21_018753 [Puccinia graminis f. sp. tritici]|uniref:Uncharacterized protein n=1 Tax=Puccinia graminis f. sp. tritici TaxID=56615 RepID=A0A5B0QTP3_PUCGR|nr:hypothetical protein PGT21_018753 [Puccinia graminis f. sp. tritici]
MVELQAPLPPAPPKPSFANRIKIKLEYNDLKSQFYQVTNLKESLFHDLSEKQAKEFKLRMECDLILDQIELIRSRMPISEQPEGRAEGGDDWELRRVRKYQENPGGGFMYESDEDLIRGRSSASSASPSSSSSSSAPHEQEQQEQQLQHGQEHREARPAREGREEDEDEDAEAEMDDEEHDPDLDHPENTLMYDHKPPQSVQRHDFASRPSAPPLSSSSAAHQQPHQPHQHHHHQQQQQHHHQPFYQEGVLHQPQDRHDDDDDDAEEEEQRDEEMDDAVGEDDEELVSDSDHHHHPHPHQASFQNNPRPAYNNTLHPHPSSSSSYHS